MLSLPIAGLSAAMALLTLTGASAGTLAGAEIDADQLSPGDPLFSQTADDWAESGGSAAEGVFLLGTAGSPDFTGCYGSDLSVNPSITGAAGFICDGSSDSRFDGNGGDTVVEPEMNIVSPGGKQIDDIWNVKAGGVTAKDDFSHAYKLFRTSDSSCDSDSEPDDRFLVLVGHRGDNEGDAFWGFELSQIPPARFADVVISTGATFDLDFNRTPGDLLVSFTLVSGGTSPQLEVFSWNGATFAPAPNLCAGSQGDSLLRTNSVNDIQAPPWNVPVCDPTSTNSANTCRVVNQNGAAPATAGDNRLAPRDFNDAIVDLGAFVFGSVCFNSLLFTSRSAHPLETADLKDVGGADINTCPAPRAPPAAPPAAPPPAAPPPGAPPGGPLPPVALPPPTGNAPDPATPLWLLTAALSAAAVSLFVLAGFRRPQ
ncbi:MAG TPA: hypothetical protein VGR43_09260 [Dehalococcoidia bacterium]|jgi:hypothetical protein|nr:hypothetical protein [Dehalococcoidia bacterium]